MLELYQLVQLLAIAECGTISKAAEQLHLSQPALSRSMQKLEEELQVTLFDRQKNKITLNKNGRLAVEQARRVVEQAQNLVDQVRAFDRSQRTISIGCCAPAPLVELVSLVSQLYPEMAISSGAKELSFQDIDGESVLLFSQIGFWREVCRQKMPLTRTLVQTEQEDFDELVQASALPCFSSDWAIRQYGKPQNRIVIPISDPEGTAVYHFLCRREDRRKFSPLIGRLQRRQKS